MAPPPPPLPTISFRHRLERVATGGGEYCNREVCEVIVLGIVLLIIGFIAKIAILWTLGIILLAVGVVLVLMGSRGRAVGGRRHYY
jgi:Zn-dependent membrane protease YugP